MPGPLPQGPAAEPKQAPRLGPLPKKDRFANPNDRPVVQGPPLDSTRHPCAFRFELCDLSFELSAAPHPIKNISKSNQIPIDSPITARTLPPMPADLAPIFDPPPGAVPLLLDQLADPDLSFHQVASLNNTSTEALAAFIASPDIQQRLLTLQQAAATRTRLVTSGSLLHAARALTRILQDFVTESAQAGPEPKTPVAAEQRHRARESARKAAALLFRLANFDPTRPRLRVRPAQSDPLAPQTSESQTPDPAPHANTLSGPAQPSFEELVTRLSELFDAADLLEPEPDPSAAGGPPPSPPPTAQQPPPTDAQPDPVAIPHQQPSSSKPQPIPSKTYPNSHQPRAPSALAAAAGRERPPKSPESPKSPNSRDLPVPSALLT